MYTIPDSDYVMKTTVLKEDSGRPGAAGSPSGRTDNRSNAISHTFQAL